MGSNSLWRQGKDGKQLSNLLLGFYKDNPFGNLNNNILTKEV